MKSSLPRVFRRRTYERKFALKVPLFGTQANTTIICIINKICILSRIFITPEFSGKMLNLIRFPAQPSHACEIGFWCRTRTKRESQVAPLLRPYFTRESYFPARAEPLSMHIENVKIFVVNKFTQKNHFCLSSIRSFLPRDPYLIFLLPKTACYSSFFSTLLSTIIISSLNNSSLIVKYVFLTHTFCIVHCVKLCEDGTNIRHDSITQTR